MLASKSRRSPSALACAFLVLASALCLAQTEVAVISGRVTDATGTVVPRAEVVLQSAGRWTTTRTRTNENGIYNFSAVNPGVYHITVRKEGFRQVDFVGLTANVQAHINQNFRLQIGATSESITVSENVATLNTESPAVSTVVDQQFVENMPLNGRSFQSLISLTPGVVITTAGLNGAFSVDGQRTDANYVTVDGVSANFGSNPTLASLGLQSIGGTTPAFSGGGTNGLISVDAMQEFRIQTSSYAPEFGRSPGAQISLVTRSGTNQWHGTAYDYLRNDIFDARNWFNRPPDKQAPLRQNDFGGTVGGPLWRDHTFFFLSYEGLRLRQPQTSNGYYLTSNAKAAVTGPWAPVISAFPTGTGALLDATCDNVTTPCVRALQASFSNPSTLDSYALRLDDRLTGKVSIFARYDHAPSTAATFSLNLENPQSANIDTATVGVTAALSPTMVNDFRGNWSRYTSKYSAVPQPDYGAVLPPTSAVVPTGFVGDVFYAVLANGNVSDLGLGSLLATTQRQFNFVDTLSRTVGFHQLKFGVDFRRINPTQRATSELSFGGFSWSSVLNGTVDFFINDTSDTITAHMNNWSLFGQDVWKVLPRLTLTYGLRWEINTPPVSDTSGKPLYAVSGIFDSNPVGIVNKPLWSTQLDAFAPRIGAAFQLNTKTVVRGGFGLFYDLGYGSGLSEVMGGVFPYTRQSIARGIPLNLSLGPYQPIPFTTTINASTLGLVAMDPNLRLPATYHWNGAVERELGNRQTISLTYVGASGQNLLHQDNILPPGSIVASSELGVGATRNAGVSHYNGLQLQFMRRMSRGLQTLVSYSYAHSSDMGSDDQSLSSFPSIESVTLPPLTRSDFDIRHSFSAAISYDIPRPTWSGKAGEAIFRGWGVDGIYRLQSGPPLDVIVFAVDPGFGSVTLRPARVLPQPVWIPDPTQPAGKALNPAAFTLGPNGVSDDALRNSIQSPYGISQADLALRRSFHITERLQLQLRAEYFNIFNHPMFEIYFPYWGFCSGNTPASCAGGSNPYFGKVGATLNQFVSGSGVGTGTGQNAQYAVGGPRSGQFALKLIF
jgi:Carboxypeptidase regulatory-like domain/TonB dependent receptor